jgi:hypothetical protein
MFKFPLKLFVFLQFTFVFLSFPSTLEAADPVVVAAGDIACGSGSGGAACRQMDTSNLIGASNPSAVLLLGDNQYENGGYSDWINFYDKSWGRFKNITYPSVGNHEYLTPGAAGYFDYFNGVGSNTGAAGERSKGYYAFNVGTWRLYAINSNCSQAGGCGAGSPQERWLRSDLAANPRQCVIAFYHHPMFTSGSRFTTAIKPLLQALYDHGGDITLAGHEHNYERFAPMDANGNLDRSKGIRHFIVGTGGRNFTAFTHVEANSEVRNDRTFGILKLTLKPGSYDAEFLPISGSTFSDKLLNQPCVGATGTIPPTPQNTNTPVPTGSGIGKPGDINGDNKVDIVDVGLVIDNYGRNPIPNIKTDINNDGVVNIIDIGIIIDNYGK